MTRVAVLGLGIGKTHLREYVRNPHAQLVAVADMNRDLADQLGAEYNVPSYGSLDELLANAKPEAVSVCTPPAVHAEQVEQLAAAGIHALVEKPMAPTLEDCVRMIRASEKRGTVLMIGQKKRFSGPYAFLKARIDGDFGQPLWASIQYALGRVEKDWFWREADGGGPLLENAIHMYDLVRFLMGEVRTVAAHGGNLFRPDVAPQLDTAAISFGMASGGVVSLGCGYGAEWGFASETVALASRDMCAQVSGPFDNPNRMRLIHRDAPGDIQDLDFEASSGFAEEISEFLCAIHEHRTPSVTGRDAARSIALALAVKRAIRDRKPIRMRDAERPLAALR